ncbi:MAG TPA: HAD family hydrolase [Blastocatellia bacterium]|nr:HAD family hydrolase [Blastocatellia bacterium]
MKPAAPIFDVIAFDADDTLWHNEPLFTRTKRKFEQLLTKYHSPEWIDRRLDETEMRNIRHFGYGIKGFTLSMIETAVELTEGRVTGAEIMEIIGFAREMMQHPVELLEGAHETVTTLAESYKLILVTKGDLFDQESKIARSGLGDYFSAVEIVSEKVQHAYEKIMARHGIQPSRFLMVGNSLRSDILPVIAAGGYAVYVPYPTTWIHEHVEDYDREQTRLIEIERINLLPSVLNELTAGG